MQEPCPLYPQKRTLIDGSEMSAKCQKRTYDDYKKQKDRLAAVSPKTDQVI
jgi:hypothetical protein